MHEPLSEALAEAVRVAEQIAKHGYTNMQVGYSPDGEYTSSINIISTSRIEQHPKTGAKAYE